MEMGGRGERGERFGCSEGEGERGGGRVGGSEQERERSVRESMGGRERIKGGKWGGGLRVGKWEGLRQKGEGFKGRISGRVKNGEYVKGGK